MALNKMHLLIFIIMAALISTTTMARDLAIKPGQGLVVRLNNKEGSSGLVDCWNALLELKSCTNEIIVFLLDGETHLGNECCKAIHIITRQCWPSMLTSLGFTAQEGDILQGYCDESVAPSPSPATTVIAPVLAPALSPSALVPVVMG